MTSVKDPLFVQAKSKAIRKNVLFDAERAVVLSRMEEAGIWYMPLKGCVLKEMYPQIGMRQMGDIDILFDDSRADDVKGIMEKLEYTAKYFGRSVHDCYYKEPVFNFEMHRALFGEGHGDSLKMYYEDVRDRLVKDAGTDFGYHLSPEDCYLYIIAHEYKLSDVSGDEGRPIPVGSEGDTRRVGGCGSLLPFAGGFRMIAEDCGRFRKITDDCGWLI